jgi:hypothetical protein
MNPREWIARLASVMGRPRRGESRIEGPTQAGSGYPRRQEHGDAEENYRRVLIQQPENAEASVSSSNC